MYWVYFLYSKSRENVYVGCTRNLRKRLKEHQDGLVESTRKRRPLILFHTEKYNSLSTARRREKYLKSLYGCRERKRILEECFKKNKHRALCANPYGFAPGSAESHGFCIEPP